jgi:hypothetical protein
MNLINIIKNKTLDINLCFPVRTYVQQGGS